MENNRPLDGSERLLVLLSYGLMLIAPPSGGLAGLIGVLIAHVRLGHAEGGVFASHYRNIIRVFWTMLVFWLVVMITLAWGAGLSVFSLFWPFGWPWHFLMLSGAWIMLSALAGIVSIVLVIWFYWRLIAGFLRALDDRPY